MRFPPSASPRPPGRGLVWAEGTCFGEAVAQRRGEYTGQGEGHEGAGSQPGPGELSWTENTPLSTKVTSLNMSRHFIFQNGNMKWQMVSEERGLRPWHWNL